MGLDASKFNADAAKASSAGRKAGTDATNSAKGMEDGVRKALESTSARLGQLERAGKATAAQFRSFRLEVASVFAAFATGFGLRKFIEGMTSAETQTGRTAKIIGMSVTDLNMWQEAAKKVGGSAEGITSTIQNFSEEFEKIRLTGHSDLQQWFTSLGVSISDINGKLRPMDQIMGDIAEKFKARGPVEANFFAKNMGISEGALPLFLEGREKQLQQLEEAKKHGLMTPSDVENAKKYEAQLATLEQSISKLKRAFLNAALPEITKFLKALTDWISDPKNQEFVSEKVLEGVKTLSAALGSLTENGKSWLGIGEALVAFMTGRFLLMGAGLGPLGIAIAGIVAGLVALKQLAKPTDPHDDPDSLYWQGMSEEDQLKDPKSPISRRRRGELGTNTNTFSRANPFTWLDTPASTAGRTMSDAQRGLLNTIAGPESGGDYHVLNGGERVEDLSHHPNRIGKNGKSRAFGKYQFIPETWERYARKLNLPDMSEVSQDRAAWAYAQDLYRAHNGRDLEPDVADGKHAADIAAAFKGAWSSMPGGAESSQSLDTFSDALRRNQLTRPSLSSGATRALEGLRDPNNTAPSPIGQWLHNLGQQLQNRHERMHPDRYPPTERPTGERTSSIETNFNGPVNIYTPATDGHGIARDFQAGVRRHAYVTQANTGLT